MIRKASGNTEPVATLRNRPKRRAASRLARAAIADLRESPLYKEAEALFESVLRPGSGRPSSATEPAVSPDGKRIAFTGTVLEKLEGASSTRICIADLRSGDLRVVSFGPGSDTGPKFSPDGGTLAFRSDRVGPGDFQLYFLDLISGQTRAGPVPDGWIEYLEYSPDGTHLLLGVAGHGADVAGAQGAKTSKILHVGEALSWMPAVQTGDEAFRRRAAWVVKLDDGSFRRISPQELNVWEACWCGNGAIGAVVSKNASEEDWYRAHLVRIELVSGKARGICTPKDQVGALSASPDGRRLAFVEAVCSDRWVVAGNLHIVDFGTGRVQPLAINAVDVSFTTWRDNRCLLVAGIRDFETVVADVDVRSATIREHWCSKELYSQNFFYPAAAPCPDDNGVVVAATGHARPTELLHIVGRKPRRVVALGHEGTDTIARKLRPVKPYTWKAPDGTEIHGWLMRGAGDGRAPIVMDIHGGPIWRWPPIFLGRLMHHVMLAARGYALFWPNPRGSSGRGQDYAGAVVGDMGGADTLDHLSGLDQLVAEGIADPKRIGVTGGSYGGFMTSWLITRDQRFAAAVAVAPVTDWISQHLTTNIPYFDALCLGGKYTDPTSNYHSRSPVMFAHRVKTPTLHICGALDRCTPPGQAMEFHNALLQNGVDSMLVTYPNEGHGVSSFPGLIDYTARVVEWFIRYMA